MVFQLLESRGNWRPTEGPRKPELDLSTTSGRATNDQIERQETPHRDHRPANRPRKRQGGADARHSRRSSTQVVESPSKATGHSLTLALDAEATAANLGYARSKKLQAEMRKQHSPKERRHCSHISEITEGCGTKNVPTSYRNSRLARQPPSRYRKRTEESSVRLHDRKRSRKTARGIARPLAVAANPWRASKSCCRER